MDVDIAFQHMERASHAQQWVPCTLCLVAYLGIWTSAVMHDEAPAVNSNYGSGDVERSEEIKKEEMAVTTLAQARVLCNVTCYMIRST